MREALTGIAYFIIGYYCFVIFERVVKRSGKLEMEQFGKAVNMSQLNTIVPTVIKEWKSSLSHSSRIYMLLGNASRAAVLAWIVYQSGAFGTLGYVAVGTALLAMWTGVLNDGRLDAGERVIRQDAGLHDDFPNQDAGDTLQLRTLARCFIRYRRDWYHFSPPCGRPRVAGLFQRSYAAVKPGISPIKHDSYWLLLFRAGGAGIGQSGVLPGIMPFIAVISGFILPVNQLPLWLEIPARITPSAWGMDTVWAAIKGIDSWAMVARDWGMSLLLIAVWLGIIYYLCSIVEKRIRITGNLGDY